jgi:hypothetical protein
MIAIGNELPEGKVEVVGVEVAEVAVMMILTEGIVILTEVGVNAVEMDGMRIEDTTPVEVGEDIVVEGRLAVELHPSQ